MMKIKLSERTKRWFKAAGVRAVKTIAQTAVGVIGASTVISSVDWEIVLSSAVLAGIVSMLTSIAGLPEVSENKIESEEK